MSTAATKLDRIVDEFAGLEPRERLELLLEFAESLPALPPRYQAEKDRGEHRVHECQTPVFLWVEVIDGQVQVYGDVAPEAPTVKGFVGILVDAFSGSSPEEVLSVQPDLLQRLGLLQALGMMRMRGLQAIQFTILDQVRKAAEKH
ncbi:MAG TPA: SufE family protein [Pirellulales bacterium]|jgi:cysteine desulfuration protein SufE|nr:SufE family protein [Pirellulales bacterium]